MGAVALDGGGGGGWSGLSFHTSSTHSLLHPSPRRGRFQRWEWSENSCRERLSCQRTAAERQSHLCMSHHTHMNLKGEVKQIAQSLHLSSAIVKYKIRIYTVMYHHVYCLERGWGRITKKWDIGTYMHNVQGLLMLTRGGGGVGAFLGVHGCLLEIIIIMVITA